MAKPSLTGLQITSILTNMSKSKLHVPDHKYLYKLTDILSYAVNVLDGYYNKNEILKFLLSWKPNEETLTFFNSGITEKYFFYVRISQYEAYIKAQNEQLHHNSDGYAYNGSNINDECIGQESSECTQSSDTRD